MPDTPTRVALALLLVAIALVVDFVACRRGRFFGLPFDGPLDARDRAWRSALRTVAAGAALGAAGLVLWLDRPARVFLFAALGALLPPLVLGVGARRAARRHDLLPPLRFPAVLGAPAHVFNAATVALAAITFRAVQPLLPSIMPLHWAGLGSAGYGSPQRLWWTLALVAFNTALMLLVARAVVRGEGPASRRVALLRFAETVLTGLNLAAALLWLGVALGGLPGVDLVRPALIAAGAVTGGALLLALGLYAPQLLARGKGTG
ncbi:MAG TPA: hypothetical protein RMH85_05285 [Polyangiaceae bacterium LLY-WYZ-15_(1-7)]|nr:hypothetical protein [Myxococcales bacterium]MAT26336.1 hypothetical protein [Sandaracinus sp.]HJL04746.1 hypothetical protein [Polyangiaceae bacterium LLY-WYZ-15_(1-7)]MBJ74435.1 hypothetical protein [Sandaracinus sp.]HJL07886.1 hypothetical protein [Polyangiaceae bacterium LLY-WYZ-15_(1-7)]